MQLPERARPAARLADDHPGPTLAAKRRLSECAWGDSGGALCSLCTESLGCTWRDAVKTAVVALILAGASVACRSPRARSPSRSAATAQSSPQTQRLAQPSGPSPARPQVRAAQPLFLIPDRSLNGDPRDLDTTGWHGLFQTGNTFVLATARVTA